MTGKNNIINLLFNANKNYIHHQVIVPQSIYENNKENKVKISLFVSDDVERNQKGLSTVKESGFGYEIIPVNPANFTVVHTSHHATLATRYRLNRAKLLPEQLNKIIYLDADLIVRRDLKGLWDTDILDYAIWAICKMSFNRYAELHYRNTYPRKATYFYYLRKTGFKIYNPLIEHIKTRVAINFWSSLS